MKLRTKILIAGAVLTAAIVGTLVQVGLLVLFIKWVVSL